MSLISRRFSSEHRLTTPEQQTFWRTVVQGRLTAADGISLAYMVAHHPKARASIVLSSGRVESYLKYQELAFDLHQQGYSVFAIDHRGQGLSDRMTANPHQGYVRRFGDYVDDFALFIEQVVLTQAQGRLYLLGHSMGGAIGTLYLQQFPGVFRAAAFSAPMYGIKLPMPKGFIRWLANKLDRSRHGAANYVLGGQDYCAVSFKDNELTHSETRYQAYRALYAEQPVLQLGSPTNHWLIEALDAADACVLATSEIDTPILILQAGDDGIVDNAAQWRAMSSRCQIRVIEGASHELFIEKDAYREQALNFALDWFERSDH
ncbi:MAG: alpha/beta fold hydrolase [Shewanella sp.]